MQRKCLILSLTTKDDYALAEWRKNGVDTDLTLKDIPKALRLLRRFWIRWHLPLQSIWYGDWKKSFWQYDFVLVHGTWLAEDVPHWMKKIASQKGAFPKLVWWYWNTVVEKDHPDRVSQQDCEKWSFDQGDCKKYGMRHNTQYYFKSFQLPQVSLTTDVYFLGSDGGRMDTLLDLEKKWKAMGIRTDFHIVVKHISDAYKNRKAVTTKHFSYTENLEHIAASKAVLEILRPGQAGQTLRALECLFFGKKLITNDKSVMQQVYYHPDNIFVLGEDVEEKLSDFLEKPFFAENKKYCDYFDCKQWLERFWEENDGARK